MSFFSAVKQIFNFKKELKKGIAAAKEKEKHYISMGLNELLVLSDDELFDAVIYRTENRVNGFDEWKNGVDSLNSSQKICYSLSWFELEVNNGGLCQFFINSSRIVAPLVSEYMGIVGALEHKRLYDTFVKKNGIDLRELSFFDVEKAEEFEEKAQSYPFDKFDDAFCELEPLELYLKSFIKEHLEDF